MTRPPALCRHWIGAKQRHCHVPNTRPYLPGPRCLQHTPAVLAGKPEPPSVPLHPYTPLEGTTLMTSTNPLLMAAIAAAERGWHVFPLRPNDKRPAFPDHTAERCTGRDPRCADRHVGWEPRATTDPDRIRRAWSLAPFNVGVACGPSGLLVVDLDMPKCLEPAPEAWQIDGVETGEDVLAVLCERAGQPLPALYDTFTVVTTSGGRHLYFTPPADSHLGNTAKTLGWLVDTRAHGGYVVAAGSVVSGRPYRLDADLPIAPLPAWLFQRLSAAAAPSAPVTVATGTGRRSAYLSAAINREAERVTSATSGGRNHALYTATVALGQLVAGRALTAAEVTTLLEQACAGHVAAGAFTASEARKTIASGLRAGAKRPRTVAA
jgi:hypothetical protein